MAKKMTIGEDKATFTMTIKGASLPDNFEAEISTVIDYTGATREQLITACSGGQSARVMLQGQLRKKTVPVLNGYAENGLTVKFTDIVAGSVTKPIDKIMALSKEDFCDMMILEFEMDDEQAEALYDKKHGLAPANKEQE